MKVSKINNYNYNNSISFSGKFPRNIYEQKFDTLMRSDKQFFDTWVKNFNKGKDEISCKIEPHNVPVLVLQRDYMDESAFVKTIKQTMQFLITSIGEHAGFKYKILSKIADNDIVMNDFCTRRAFIQPLDFEHYYRNKEFSKPQENIMEKFLSDDRIYDNKNLFNLSFPFFGFQKIFETKGKTDQIVSNLIDNIVENKSLNKFQIHRLISTIGHNSNDNNMGLKVAKTLLENPEFANTFLPKEYMPNEIRINKGWFNLWASDFHYVDDYLYPEAYNLYKTAQSVQIK